MKITIPENISEITLHQFQRYDALVKRELDAVEFTKRKINIFTGIKYNELDRVSNIDFNEVSLLIDKALNEDAEFCDMFELNGIKFGFIPNFDKIQFKEFIDLSLYPLEDVNNLNKVMAILFRPVINKDSLGNYKIEDYNGTEKYSELMKFSPMNVVNGMLVFFCNLTKELQNSIQKSSSQEQERELVH